MYLRTPKRYQPGRKRHLRLISRRTIFLLLLTIAGVAAAWYIWNNQSDVRSSVLPKVEQIAENVQTQVAPKPTPTATPNLEVAQVGCTNSYQQGNMEEAIKQCTILAESSPNDVNLYYQLAHMLIITSNWGQNADRLDEALTYAERTINADPEAPHGWAIRAMALDWSEQYGKALASALHAKALDDGFAPTYAFLGEIYHDLGQDDVATTYLEQAVQLDTGGLAVADTFRTQGLIYSSQGYYEDALRPYEIALQDAPNYTYISIELANNYKALNQLDTAIQILSTALDRDQTDTALLFALANTYLKNGNRDRAYEFYRRCLDNDPDNKDCLSYLGGLQYADGDYVTAITNLERAITMGSEDPVDYLQIGISYVRLERCDMAIPYFQQGYQLASNEDQQNRFASELEGCGVTISPSTNSDSADTGSSDTAPTEESTG